MSRRHQGRIQAATLLAGLLVAGGVLVLVMIFAPEPGPEALTIQSSRQCLECHADVAAEWKESQHAQAYTNPEVRKLSQDFRNEECIACHAPRLVLAFAPGERVLARNADRGMGVDCLACHLLVEGEGVATTNPAPDPAAPCRPRTVARIGQVDFCGSCHNQHGTVDQWHAAPAELKGKGCLECHMPEVWREGGRKGRNHRSLAGHDPEMVRAAVVLEGEWSAEGPRVAVSNTGAGHNFPTDERSRAADVQVRWRDAGSGWSAWEHVWRMRDPYRDELDLTNTQLPAGQRWEVALTPPPGAAGGEARLLYRTNPFLPDDDSVEVARIPLEP